MANWFNPAKENGYATVTLTDPSTVVLKEAIAYDIDENSFGVIGYCTVFTQCEEVGNKYFKFEPQILNLKIFKKDFTTEWMDKAKGEKKISEKKQTPTMKLLAHYITGENGIGFGNFFRAEFELAINEQTAQMILTRKNGDKELSDDVIDLLLGGNLKIEAWDEFDATGNPALTHLKDVKIPEGGKGGNGRGGNYQSKDEGKKLDERLTWALADLEKGEESKLRKLSSLLLDEEKTKKDVMVTLICG